MARGRGTRVARNTCVLLDAQHGARQRSLTRRRALLLVSAGARETRGDRVTGRNRRFTSERHWRQQHRRGDATVHRSVSVDTYSEPLALPASVDCASAASVSRLAAEPSFRQLFIYKKHRPNSNNIKLLSAYYS